MENTFAIGASEADITPPTGLPMDGYMARTMPSTGTHDPLLAQIVVLEHGGQRAAIVTLDLLAVSQSWTDALRAEMAALLHTRPEAILVAASHTHAGPAGTQDWFPVGANTRLDDSLVAHIRSRIRTAAEQALAGMQPCTLRSGVGSLPGIGGDRNHPNQPVDSQVAVLSFHDATGTPLAVLFHFACHPTVLSAANLLYSADFPGAARERIRENYPGAVCLYLNGAAGNISTRYHRRDQTFEEVTRLGRQLGDHVIGLIEQAQPQTARLVWDCATLELPLRLFAPAPRLLETTGDARQDTVRAEGVAIEADLRRAFGQRVSQTAQVSGLQIGGWQLLAVPGEAFSELATALRKDGPQALVVGYANDYLGYFPTQDSIDNETYEALSSPYDSRAHQRLYDDLAILSRNLHSIS